VVERDGCDILSLADVDRIGAKKIRRGSEDILSSTDPPGVWGVSGI